MLVQCLTRLCSETHAAAAATFQALSIGPRQLSMVLSTKRWPAVLELRGSSAATVLVLPQGCDCLGRETRADLLQG